MKTTKDGREILDMSKVRDFAEYRNRTMKMAREQGFLCCLCGQRMPGTDVTYDHELGRGMGGGRRDDRIYIDGKPINGAAHGLCNSAKASRRVPYVIQRRVSGPF